MLPQLEVIARKAGDAIMEVFREAHGADGVESQQKTDGSPVTEADRRAHAVISKALAESWPDIPIFSEEGKNIPFVERSQWKRYWLVDPLDGTKEFIRGLDEFTVNIALIEGGRPVLGVVYAPAKDVFYSGSLESGAVIVEPGQPPRAIKVLPPDPPEGLIVVVSRSHPSDELEDYLRDLPVAERIPSGSSLKLCAIAEGRAHLYPRLGPTSEWDIAAGQAVVEAAGGEVVDLDGRPLAYNKENILNPDFVARGRAG